MNFDALRAEMHPVTGASGDYDALLDLIGDASIVCIGEASHGTHEFYSERATITKRLIDEKGFDAVAVEADWPDAYRVNRYVRGMGDDADAIEALDGFRSRFPTWMWRNADVLDFVGWLRSFNDPLATEEKVGFYGVDLYSLFSSIEAVIRYLDQVDPDAAQRARKRYACFDHFGDEAQAYGYATATGIAESCEEEVVNQLTELRRRAADLANRDGHIPPDEYFYAEQNARLVTNAEEYYRSMYHGRVSSWNLRDRHMAETIDALVAHLGKSRGGRARLVVWEHNSHLGDARFTEMGQQGELNVGQLVRERYEDQAVLIGFSTYTGTVTAATDWDAPAERKKVRPGMRGSYEDVLHQVSTAPYYLMFRGGGPAAQELDAPRLQRAIGVIYRPETERQSHYFHARLPRQFDAMIHFDETRAVEPLERIATWHHGEVPETYPSGV